MHKNHNHPSAKCFTGKSNRVSKLTVVRVASAVITWLTSLLVALCLSRASTQRTQHSMCFVCKRKVQTGIYSLQEIELMTSFSL